MKSITCFLLFITGLFITIAPASAQKDAKAKELLDKTSVMFNQAGGMSASFSTNVKDDANKINQSFEGQIFLKGEKFYLSTPDQEVYFDGKTQWTYDKNIGEVSILNPQPQDIQTLNPVSVFELYKTDCNYKFKGEKTDNQKRKVQEVSLFPTNSKVDIKQVDIQINPSDSMPVFFFIVYNDRSEFRIYVNKYQTKLNLPDSRFVFDAKKYPNVEINDLR